MLSAPWVGNVLTQLDHPAAPLSEAGCIGHIVGGDRAKLWKHLQPEDIEIGASWVLAVPVKFPLASAWSGSSLACERRIPVGRGFPAG
jgi:hypothetical protein